MRETIYHGDHMRVRVAVLGNEDFTVKMRYRANRPVPTTGEKLFIGFTAQDCLALSPPNPARQTMQDDGRAESA